MPSYIEMLKKNESIFNNNRRLYNYIKENIIKQLFNEIKEKYTNCIDINGNMIKFYKHVIDGRDLQCILILKSHLNISIYDAEIFFKKNLLLFKKLSNEYLNKILEYK